MNAATAQSSVDHVWVIGHRHPDTDAVCSALAYAAWYEWQTGTPTVACHLDDIGPETSWLLQQLQLSPPRQIADVYLRVADIMETGMPFLHGDQTLHEAGTLMQAHKLGALPVVDAEQHLLGLLSRDTLADRFLHQLQLSDEIDLPVAALQRTLEATLVTGQATTRLRDRVWIATFSGAAASMTITMGDIVVVGDQPDVQHTAIEAGAGCLIITDGAPLGDDLIIAARERDTVLLQTSHSSFAAALLLQQSIPVDRIMDREPPVARTDDLLADAQALLRRGRISGLPVVDEQGTLRGLVLRRHLLPQNRRRVILTDHNHADQAAPGVTESQIVAIVDHHNLGGLQTLQPLTVLCEPVGCTCTLIAELYQRTAAPITAGLAGAMLGAILSDTVHFRSPTTTQRDRRAAAWLEAQSGLEAAPLARDMFRARLPRPIPPAGWWVSSNWKTFSFGDQEIGIGQIELTDIESVMPPRVALRQALQAAVRDQGLTSAFLLLTDILEERSLLLTADPAGESLAERAFGSAARDGVLDLPGVMSRKQQVVPPLAATLTATT